MLAFFCLGARYRPWRYFAALHSRVFGDGAAPRRTRCSPQPRQHSVFRASDRGAFSKSCLRRRFFCGESGSCLVRGESKRSSMARSSRMRSRATGSGNIPPRCVPGRSTMAKCSRNAFPSVRQWQDCALMRPWPDWQRQYSATVRSRASIRGNFFASCIPKAASDGENRQFVARFARHASENGLALARYARHASEMPRKSPLEDTPREDLARKGSFSLHGPLESCTARRSCRPS